MSKGLPTGRRARRRALQRLGWAAVCAAIALPLSRRRLALPHVVTATAAVAGPIGLAVAARRTRPRDVGIYVLQMWAFIVVHELPYDEPGKLESRVRVHYPIVCDRMIGLGEQPTLRLQRALGRPGSVTALDHSLTWVHWLWFIEPHAAAAWILWKRPERFTRTALMICSLFDLGAIVYLVVPTAPPWWAAERGALPGVRRVMVEVGERTWGRLWTRLYDFLGGNPVAAMPSLHFATSLMAAKMLSEAGPVEGAVARAYAWSLGFALVYLGEHYVIDLLAGLALAEAVYRVGPRTEPLLLAASRAIRALEA